MKTILQNRKPVYRILFVVLLAFIFLTPVLNAQTLVGHWPFNTNANDTSGNGNNGTITGSPTWETGIHGYAIKLSGSGQYVTIPEDDNTLDVTSSVTFSAWIKPQATGTQRILYKVSGSTGYELFLEGVSPFRLSGRFNNSASLRVNSTTSYSSNLNNWLHFAVTYNGSVIRLFVNGIKEDSVTSSFLIATNDLTLGIGANPAGINLFNGSSDDVRIYDGALSEAQILALATVIPPIPLLNTPANGVIDQPLNMTLSWFTSYSATSYRVQVSTVSDFSSTVFDQSGITTTSTSVNGLSSNTQYYWRVNATNAQGTSDWSTVRNFTTVFIQTIIDNGAGYALDFDGTDDWVNCGNDASVNITGAITMEAWINPDALGLTGSIIKKNTATTGYEFSLASSDRVFMRLWNGGTSYRIDSETLFSVGAWVHIAAVYDGVNTMRLFINGRLDSLDTNGPPSSISTNSNPILIGSDLNSSTRDFNGKMDEVRLWNVERTQAQIQENMCKKLAGNESGLVGYWRFDEADGLTVNDETGVNDGNLVNSNNDEHVWSGAAIGDASASDYSGTLPGDFFASLGISSETFTATASTGTITGLQVYRVDDNSFRTLSTEDSSWTVDPLRYWGVKVIGTGSPTYGVVYDYTNHPGIITDANLRLVKRDNVSDASWSKVIATLDSVANTLTSTTDQTGTEYSLASTSDPLPVELSSFSASILKNAVKLKWRTETEVRNFGFEILRSAQDDNWEVIGFVEGHGNSNSPKDYSFIDDKVTAGKYSYRLKQIDTDGQYSYSKIIAVDFGSAVKFELSQNYPNPFNPVTTIRFSLPQSDNVRLTVYNILGEQVAVLINGFRDAGVHTINFDAGNFNSGLYIYKIESNGLVQTRKMLLVK